MIQHTRAVLIIAAGAGLALCLVLNLMTDTKTADANIPVPAPPPPVAAPPDATAAYLRSLPRPAPPRAPVAQASAPPCVAPPPKGQTTYFCDDQGRLHFWHHISGLAHDGEFRWPDATLHE
jgi:hypothetical protein